MRRFDAIQRFRDAGGLKLPFISPVPELVRDQLLVQQAERLQAYLPLLCLVIATNAVAMTLAVMGDLPWWQQFTPPFLIIASCLMVLVRRHGQNAPVTPTLALRHLQNATWMAGGLGLIAGFWGVNAFTETERYYCMVAPVFIGIAALVSATCLFSAPRAAIAAMLTTVAPVVVKMLTFDYVCVQAMAAMMVLVTFMQASVVIAKFRETVGILVMRRELERLAATDALTGLDNRHAFIGKLQSRLDNDAQLTLLLADLDSFKAANDAFGHLAGDAILMEVGARLRQLVPHAVSIARLGGDEFAILLEHERDTAAPPACSIETLRAAIRLPIIYADNILSVSASFGSASCPDDSTDETGLISAADQRLYADKAARRSDRRKSKATKRPALSK